MVRYEYITGATRPNWKKFFREWELGDRMTIKAKDYAQIGCIRSSANQINKERSLPFFLTVSANTDTYVVEVTTKLMNDGSDKCNL